MHNPIRSQNIRRNYRRRPHGNPILANDNIQITSSNSPNRASLELSALYCAADNMVFQNKSKKLSVVLDGFKKFGWEFFKSFVGRGKNSQLKALTVESFGESGRLH